MTRPRFHFVLFGILLALMAGAQAQTMDSLAKDRGKLILDYRKAVQEERKMEADQKIAMEQLKVQLARKRIGKPVTPPDVSGAVDPDRKKIADLTQKQLKQITPLRQRRKDLALQLHDNQIAQQKLRLDDQYKKLNEKSKGGK
ncbi:MAG: hypothetical protein ABT940_06485 [Alphaproteobacteria bacterium]